MSIITFLLQAVDILLWLVIAPSVLYVLIFAIASLLPKRKSQPAFPTTATVPEASPSGKTNRFLVLYPAYAEDSVIRNSVEAFLRQEYPSDHYSLTVISDHMTSETNEWLAALPITLLTPKFAKSSKAQALQFAIHHATTVPGPTYDQLVILDADNVVAPDFLSRLNALCHDGHKAIQCHRTAKNANNDIAMLDGLSEEINNTIFRRAHNRLGLSSALIGSGICLDYKWFLDHVDRLSTAGEDKELEAMLLEEKVFIHYAEDIFVMDEKVSGGDNFQRQRLRWMTAQAQCLLAMLPNLPKAIAARNINYVDKTLQQALIPRSILFVAVSFMAFVTTVIALLSPHISILTSHLALKWWLLFILIAISLFIAIPPQMRKHTIFTKVFAVPGLVLRMISNITHIDHKNTDFLHTKHGN